MLLNKEIKHVFSEAILDCNAGAARGDGSAISTREKFLKFIALGEVPLADLEWLHSFYSKQAEDLKDQTNPLLDGLKGEVSYMMNYINSKYEITEDSGFTMIQAKEGSL